MTTNILAFAIKETIMSTATTISLLDSSAVSHDFVPFQKNGNVVLYRNSEASTPAGEMTVSINLDPAKPTRKTDRVTVRFNLPFEHTVDGVVLVNDTARFEGTWTIPSNASQTQRDDFEKYVSGLIASATVANTVGDRDAPY